MKMKYSFSLSITVDGEALVLDCSNKVYSTETDAERVARFLADWLDVGYEAVTVYEV